MNDTSIELLKSEKKKRKQLEDTHTCVCVCVCVCRVWVGKRIPHRVVSAVVEVTQMLVAQRKGR